MKCFLCILPGVLTVVLASSAAGWSQEIVPAPAPAAAAKSNGSVRAANEKLVQELIAILKKTKSTDTFLVTVHALEAIGPRSKAAVPAIILNAQRLGLLKDIMQQAEDEEKDGPGIIIAEAIEHIVAPYRDRQAALPPPPYPPAPAMLPPPCVVSPLLCPVAPPAPSTEVQPQKTVRN